MAGTVRALALRDGIVGQGRPVRDASDGHPIRSGAVPVEPADRRSDAAPSVLRVTTPAAIPEVLEAGDYRDGDLEAAIASGNEIMMRCERYVWFRVEEWSGAPGSDRR